MSATSVDIKKICHDLLDRLLDAKVAFNADCIKLGKYDHDSANLMMVIDIDSTLDAAKGAYAASVNGGDVRKTLESHHDKTRPGVGTRGLPGAAQEIEALITQICERDPAGDLWREAKAKAEVEANDTPVIDPSLKLFLVCIDNPGRGCIDAMLVWAHGLRHARDVAAKYPLIVDNERAKWTSATCIGECSPIEEVLLAYDTRHLPENKQLEA